MCQKVPDYVLKQEILFWLPVTFHSEIIHLLVILSSNLLLPFKGHCLGCAPGCFLIYASNLLLSHKIHLIMRHDPHPALESGGKRISPCIVSILHLKIRVEEGEGKKSPSLQNLCSLYWSGKSKKTLLALQEEVLLSSVKAHSGFVCQGLVGHVQLEVSTLFKFFQFKVLVLKGPSYLYWILILCQNGLGLSDWKD